VLAHQIAGCFGKRVQGWHDYISDLSYRYLASSRLVGCCLLIMLSIARIRAELHETVRSFVLTYGEKP